MLMNIKRIFVFLVAFLVPSFCLAATLKTNEKLDVSENIKNIYAFSQEIKVNNDLSGDASIFSQNIKINKNIERNLLAVGADIDISGNIGASTRLVGQNITLSGTVEEDVLVLAESLKINSADIKGDLWVLANSVNINGNVGGDIKIFSSRAVIKGSVGGDIQARVSDLKLEGDTQIGGVFTYWSEKEGYVSPEAKIKNGPYFNQTQKSNSNKIYNLTYSLLSIVILALAIAYGFKRQLTQIGGGSATDFAKNIGWGLLTISALPISLILLFSISVHLALALLCLYTFFMIIAYGLSTIYTGVFVQRIVSKDKEVNLGWVIVLIGSFVYLLIGYIPFIGTTIKFIIYTVSFGYLVNKSYALIKSQSARTKSSK